MPIDKAVDHFERLGMADIITAFNTSSATVELAADCIFSPLF